MNLSERLLHGTVPLMEETLLLRKVLEGGNAQVVDLGPAGWFHAYSVKMLSDKQKNDKFKKVVSLQDYRSGKFDVWDGVAEPAGVQRAKRFCEEASNNLGKIGFRRISSDVLFRDLSSEKTRSGDPVGGLSYIQYHGIEIDRKYLIKQDEWEGGIFVLGHEWGHAYWMQMPREQKEYVKNWYRMTVLARSPVNRNATQILSPKIQQKAASKGLVPRAYSALDDQEFFADTIGYLISEPSKVPPNALSMVHAVLNGWG